MKSFRGKVAAITGAGSGIGRALALDLASQGCAVAISDINEQGLAETVQRLRTFGVKVTSAKVDVASREQVHAWADRVVAEHGQINLLVNNAGVAHSGTVEATPYEQYEWIVGINFWGVVYGTKAFLPYLKQGGDGHIVNISSVFGLFAQPGMSAYNATKYAVRGFTESLRQELDLLDCGVSATCVHPGGIKTNIARDARLDPSVRELFGRDPSEAQALFAKAFTTTAEEAAQAILAGVRGNRRRMLIGADARALESMQRLLPGAYQGVVTGTLRAARKLATRR